MNHTTEHNLLNLNAAATRRSMMSVMSCSAPRVHRPHRHVQREITAACTASRSHMSVDRVVIASGRPLTRGAH
ncbi:MAG: hypothetical protein KGS45_03530 [Planctomycetes bacterium]|nr:hypothetical protein [Planctomycetota bacterium]